MSRYIVENNITWLECAPCCTAESHRRSGRSRVAPSVISGCTSRHGHAERDEKWENRYTCLFLHDSCLYTYMRAPADFRILFFLCIPLTLVCSPKFCPVGRCLQTFGPRTSCLKTQEFARTCVYVCAHIHTSMACVCKSSSAERRGVQAGSEHSSALTSACTPSSGNGRLRRCAGAVVKALWTCIKVASTQVFARTGDSSVPRRTTYVIPSASDSKNGIFSS